MATSRQVEAVLKKFTKSVEDADKYVNDVLETIRDLEAVLKEYDADEDLNITRGVKRQINRGKDKIADLRKSVDKLDRELSDTNRKYQNLAR